MLEAPASVGGGGRPSVFVEGDGRCWVSLYDARSFHPEISRPFAAHKLVPKYSAASPLPLPHLQLALNLPLSIQDTAQHSYSTA